MDELLPQSRLARTAAIAGAAVWLLLGFYLAFLHEDAPTVLSPVAEAADRTATAKGFRFEMHAQTSTPEVGVIRMEGSGAYNGSTDRFSLELEATGNFPGIGSSFQMLEVAQGTTFYMSSPIMSTSLPDGKSWIKMDLSEILGDNVNADPRQQLAELEKVGDVTVVGDEKIRGVPTTHYRAMVDVADSGIPGYPPGTVIPSDVWIDSEGYVRRNTISMPADAAGGSFAVQMDLFGFDANPDIAIPPDAAVFDGSELLEQLEGLQEIQQ